MCRAQRDIRCERPDVKESSMDEELKPPPAPAPEPPREPRRLRVATLLNAGGVIAAAVTVAALEPKFPRFVGD